MARRVRKSQYPASPHDHYVRSVFQLESIALAFFQYVFEKAGYDALDWSTLRPNKESYVDEELRQHFTDICYTCQTPGGQPLLLSLLVEHKSQDPPKGSLRIQLVRYMTNAESKNLQNKEPFVLTIPIVLYHGLRPMTRYELKDIYEGYPAVYRAYAYDFKYLVIDLYQETDASIRSIREQSLKIVFWALKLSRDKDILSLFWTDYLTFVSLTSENGQLSHFASITTHYLFVISQPFKKRIKDMKTYSTFPSKEEIYKEAVAAIAKVWYEDELEEMRAKDRKEGIEQGIEKGIEKGIERAIRTYLRKRPEVTAVEVAELFEVDLSVVHQLMEKRGEGSTK